MSTLHVLRAQCTVNSSHSGPDALLTECLKEAQFHFTTTSRPPVLVGRKAAVSRTSGGIDVVLLGTSSPTAADVTVKVFPRRSVGGRAAAVPLETTDRLRRCRPVGGLHPAFLYSSLDRFCRRFELPATSDTNRLVHCRQYFLFVRRKQRVAR